MLNVDGCIAAIFLDLLAASGCFTEVEAAQVGTAWGFAAARSSRWYRLLYPELFSAALTCHPQLFSAQSCPEQSCFPISSCQQIVDIGYLNALFVVARSIGLVGHALDQKRLQQPLYRHPWEDVLYTS